MKCLVATFSILKIGHAALFHFSETSLQRIRQSPVLLSMVHSLLSSVIFPFSRSIEPIPKCSCLTSFLFNPSSFLPIQTQSWQRQKEGKGPERVPKNQWEVWHQFLQGPQLTAEAWSHGEKTEVDKMCFHPSPAKTGDTFFFCLSEDPPAFNHPREWVGLNAAAYPRQFAQRQKLFVAGLLLKWI